MQTKSKNTIVEAIAMYFADKPFLLNQFEKIVPAEDVEEDLSVYAAFSGSVHEMPTRSRRTKRS